jgi:hypothetical protein
MPVPNTSFGTATSAIPLSELDANFATPITLGNTAIQLGNTVTTLNNMTLANVTISSGNVTITNVGITNANVSGTANISTLVVVGNATVGGNITAANANVTTNLVLSNGTANGVAYLNVAKVLTTGSALVFDGTNLGVGAASPAANFEVSTGAATKMRLTSTADNNADIDFYTNSVHRGIIEFNSVGGLIYTIPSLPLTFGTNNTERARFNAGAPILCLAGGSTTATGTGIAFPATQSASSDANTLDDYEEGTWTVTIGASTTDPSGITYSTQQGGYTKIGNVVYIRFRVGFSFTVATGSGTLEIRGLPFTAAAGIIHPRSSPQQDNISFTGFTYLDMGASANTTRAGLAKNRSGNTAAGIDISDCAFTGTDLNGGFFYFV